MNVAIVSAASAFVFDFETDDFGIPLTNGQAICSAEPCVVSGDTVYEYGNLATVSTIPSVTGNHAGAAIFDSTVGTNALDPDLWVNKGNIMILQNDSHPNTITDPTFGKVFTQPNDEKDWADVGSIIFDFNSSVEMQSIVLVDMNGGILLDVILTDSLGKSRIYTVPQKWTQDVSACGGLGPGCVGYRTLDLTTLLPQTGEPGATGGDATVAEDLGFDANDVIQFEVSFMSFDGTSPISGGFDDITFIPEPGTGILLGLGLAAMARRRQA